MISPCISRDINRVAPPCACIVTSACLLYVHSQLKICPPWKWQVRARSTASLSGPLWLPHDSIIYPQPHPNTISPPHILPPGLFCSWSHPTHNWLLKPVQETPPDPLSTSHCIIIRFENTLIWTILTKHTAHWYKAWLATPHQALLLDCPSISYNDMSWNNLSRALSLKSTLIIFAPSQLLNPVQSPSR